MQVFLTSCSELLILCGDSYVGRLWCVWELYIHFAMAGSDAGKRTKIVNCKRLDEGAESGGASAAALASFDVKDAHCFSPDDEAKLRRVIESESADSFNAAIREAAMSLPSSSAEEPGNRLLQKPRKASSDESSDAGSSQESALPGHLRELFTELDANRDGRLCRVDLLQAMPGVPGPPHHSRHLFMGQLKLTVL